MPTNSIIPLDNYYLSKRERVLEKTIVDNFPSLMTIETTSICNLRCVMCTQSIGGVERPKHLPISAMETLSRPLASALGVQLHGIGEPLASPSFWRALDNNYFHPDCEVAINTNLTILDQKRINKLVKFNGKLLINISLDAATEKTYNRIRGFDFNTVINNIKDLLSARGDSKYPEISCNMTLMRENIEEVVQFVELSNSMGLVRVHLYQLNRYDEASMKKYTQSKNDWEFNYEQQGLWNYPTLSNKYLKAAAMRGDELNIRVSLDENKIVFYDDDIILEESSTPTVDNYVASDPEVSVKDCSYPWEWAVVMSSGDVRPCCYATQAAGNINQDDFVAIWNNDSMQQIRESILSNKVHSVCKGAACKYVQNTRINEEQSLGIPEIKPATGLRQLVYHLGVPLRVIEKFMDRIIRLRVTL